MTIDELKIGMQVKFRVGENMYSMPMTITGLFSTINDLKSGTAYLDFEGNEGDVWEVDVESIERA